MQGLGPVLQLTDSTMIPPVEYHCFLGLLVDHQLCFIQHIALAYSKGSKWVAQLHCLVTACNSLTLVVVWCLYLAVVVLSMFFNARLFWQ